MTIDEAWKRIGETIHKTDDEALMIIRADTGEKDMALIQIEEALRGMSRLIRNDFIKKAT